MAVLDNFYADSQITSMIFLSLLSLNYSEKWEWYARQLVPYMLLSKIPKHV
jgi:hypothetical protein